MFSNFEAQKWALSCMAAFVFSVDIDHTFVLDMYLVYLILSHSYFTYFSKF